MSISKVLAGNVLLRTAWITSKKSKNCGGYETIDCAYAEPGYPIMSTQRR